MDIVGEFVAGVTAADRNAKNKRTEHERVGTQYEKDDSIREGCHTIACICAAHLASDLIMNNSKNMFTAK